MKQFTVEEMNLIAIYKADTQAEVLESLQQGIRSDYEDDLELMAVIDSASRKLEAMSDADFLATAFEPVYPVLYEEEEIEGYAHGNRNR